MAGRATIWGRQLAPPTRLQPSAQAPRSRSVLKARVTDAEPQGGYSEGTWFVPSGLVRRGPRSPAQSPQTPDERQPKPPLCHKLAVRPRASTLASLSLSLLTHKEAVITPVLSGLRWCMSSVGMKKKMGLQAVQSCPSVLQMGKLRPGAPPGPGRVAVSLESPGAEARPPGTERPGAERAGSQDRALGCRPLLRGGSRHRGKRRAGRHPQPRLSPPWAALCRASATPVSGNSAGGPGSRVRRGPWCG